MSYVHYGQYVNSPLTLFRSLCTRRFSTLSTSCSPSRSNFPRTTSRTYTGMSARARYVASFLSVCLRS